MGGSAALPASKGQVCEGTRRVEEEWKLGDGERLAGQPSTQL